MREISNLQLNKFNNNVISTSQANRSVPNDTITMVKKLTAEEICQKLGITKDQLNEILTKNPTLNPESLTISDVEKYLNPKEVSTVEQPVQVADLEEKTTSNFDREKFVNASTEEKYEMLAYETAKNSYSYGDANNLRTAEQWDALSKEEQQKLVEQTKKNLNQVAKEYIDGTDIEITNSSELIDRLMTELQTADANKFPLKIYADFKASERETFKYKYLSEIENTSTLTRSEKEFLDKKTLLKGAVEYHLNTEAAKQDKDGKYNIEIDELNKTIDDCNINIIDAQYDFLNAKVKKGEDLTVFEKGQYESLKNIVNDSIYQAADKKNIKVNEDNAINALKKSEKYSEIYTNADAASQKDMIHQALLKECKDDKELYAKKLKECTEYAIADGDYKLAQELSVLINKEGVTISEDDSAASIVLATQNISEGSSETAVKNDEIADKFKNKKLAKAIQLGNRNHASEHQMVALSALKRADIDVQKANVDMRNRAENTKVICSVDDNIKANSSVEARKYAIETIGTLKQNKEAQSYCYENQISDKVPELVEAGANVIAELHKDIQTKEFKYTKAIAQDLPNAKDIEMALSDQIQNCDKDNQLDMHNEIMTSKYSEVQEHAAGNIKNYDPSVQPDAMSSVYKSGNQKAIETAVSSVSEFKSPDVQQIVMKQAVMELANLNNDSTVKFANGSLTNQDISKLSASERREYYLRLFDNASPADKIKYLKEIKDGKAKEIVYKLIGKFYPTLFKSMIQDDVTTAEKMFNMNLGGLNSVVESCIISKAETNPSFKFLRDRLKLSEEYPQTAKTVEYASIPNGFNNEKFNIYNKDKRGNLMA